MRPCLSVSLIISPLNRSIAIFETTPSSMAGTVGAIFNGALQLGGALGMAAMTSIETSVERVNGGFYGYSGRAAAFWFLFAILAIQALAVLIFYRSQRCTTLDICLDQSVGDDKSTTAQVPIVVLGYVDERKQEEFVLSK